MVINKTEQEKRNLIVENTDKSIFVEAGAGAGKTTLIVQRVTNQIKKGIIRPEELVVITFTNKAAETLFDRIQKSFEAEEKNSDNTEEERARFTYAIEHIEQIHISTIHSFCFTILKECCFEAKLPLEVSLLENAENITRQKEFYDKWLAQQDKTVMEELKKVASVVGYNSYNDKLEKLFICICEKPGDVNYVTISDGEIKRLEQEIDACIAQKELVLSQINNEIQRIAQKGKEIFERHTGESFDANIGDIKLKTFYKYAGKTFPGKGQSTKTYKDNVEKLYTAETVELCNKGKGKKKDLYAEINKEFRQWLDDEIRPDNLFEKWAVNKEITKQELDVKVPTYAYYLLLKHAVRARTDYQQELGNSVLSNDLLIQKAKDLVCNCRDACSRLAEKYKCIYVDEFQDTDHIQSELVWKLTSDENGKLKPGALFVVGDPKQAIYRFRGGEPAVYNQIKKRMTDDADTEVYELDYNFRSNKEIIDWVNNQFKEKIINTGIAYRDMKCATKSLTDSEDDVSNKQIKGVYNFNSLKDCNVVSKDKKAEYEAEKVAELIKTLVTNKYQICRMKNDECVLEPVNYGDFLILCWDTKQMKYYIDALKKDSIMVEVAGKEDIFNNCELKRFLAVYKYMINPMDKKSKQGAAQVVYREKVNGDKNIIAQRLEQLYESVKNMNCYGKAQFILKHLEYILPWDEKISKEDIHSIQTRLHQMIENVFAQTKEEPEQILKCFENYISNTLEHELILDEDKPAVRFMNLHKAKGLEGNIVIFTNRKIQSREIIPEYTLSEEKQYDYYGSIRDKNLPTIHGYYYDENTNKILEMAKAEENAEKIRLEYVAATRAKEVLIITEEYGSNTAFGDYEKPENDIESVIVMATGDENADMSDEEVAATEIEEGLKAGVSIYPEVSKEAKKEVYVSLSPSNLESVIRVDTEINEDELTNVIKKQLPRRPKGNIFGITMHRSFELLISQKLEISVCVLQAIIENYEDLLDEGVRRYLEEGEEKTVYINAVKEYLEGILKRFQDNKDIQQLLDNAKEVYTELPFSYYVSPQNEPKLFEDIKIYLEKNQINIEPNQIVWINGTADLVVVDVDGYVHIIDFKSDTNCEYTIEAFEKVIEEEYKGQLLMYKYAMAKIFGVELERITTKLYHLYK